MPLPFIRREAGEQRLSGEMQERQYRAGIRITEVIQLFASSHHSKLITSEDVLTMQSVLFPLRRYYQLGDPKSVVDQPMTLPQIPEGVARIEFEFDIAQRRAETMKRDADRSDAQERLSLQNIALGNIKGFFLSLWDKSIDADFIAQVAQGEKETVFQVPVPQTLGETVRIGRNMQLASVSGHIADFGQEEVSILQRALLANLHPHLGEIAAHDETGYGITGYSRGHHAFDTEESSLQEAVTRMSYAALGASEMFLRFFTQGGIIVDIPVSDGTTQSVCIPLPDEQMQEIANLQIFPYRTESQIGLSDPRREAFLALINQAVSQNLGEDMSFPNVFSHLPAISDRAFALSVVPADMRALTRAYPLGFFQGEDNPTVHPQTIISSMRNYLFAFHPNISEVRDRIDKKYALAMSEVREIPLLVGENNAPILTGFAQTPFAIEYTEYFQQLLRELSLMYGTAPVASDERGAQEYKEWSRRFISRPFLGL